MFGISPYYHICIIEVEAYDDLNSSANRLQIFFQKATEKIKLHQFYKNLESA